MRTLQLSDEERQVLTEHLEGKLAELDKEILHTDHAEFRQLLKHRREILGDIHDRLGAMRPGIAAV